MANSDSVWSFVNELDAQPWPVGGAHPVTTLVLAEPLVATLLGVSLLGERLAALGLAGAAFVLVGLSLQGIAASRRMSGVATPA